MLRMNYGVWTVSAGAIGLSRDLRWRSKPRLGGDKNGRLTLVPNRKKLKSIREMTVGYYDLSRRRLLAQIRKHPGGTPRKNYLKKREILVMDLILVIVNSSRIQVRNFK